ncbi:hypothetical protein MIFL109517_10430 [Micrococcus flavus]
MWGPEENPQSLTGRNDLMDWIDEQSVLGRPARDVFQYRIVST